MKYGISFLLLIVITLSCRQTVTKKEYDPDALGKFISAYTQEIISSSEEITIEFSKKPERIEITPGASAESYVQISPSIDSEIYWKDSYHIGIKPVERLESDFSFSVAVLLSELFIDVPDEILTPLFSYKTMPINLDYDLSPHLNYSQSSAQVSGSIQSTDYVAPDKIEKALSIEKGDVEWYHDEQGRNHHFTIKNIARREKKETFALSINYEKDVFKKEYTVEALDAFEVVSSTITSATSPIIIRFTGELDGRQKLDGFVLCSDYKGGFKYEIDGSKILAYPQESLPKQGKITIKNLIKSTGGKTIKEDYVASYQVDPIKPEVRLSGNGVITPFTDEVGFSFEARALNVVDVEVFKIFSDNVLQYLQNNRLNERSYYLNHVGRIIHQEKINLKQSTSSFNYDEWTLHSLDISSITTIDPGALYVIRVGYRGAYTDYPCDKKIVEGPLELSDPPASIMRYNTSYEGYNYNHNDDPCYPLYYNQNRFIQRNILASNIGVIAKGDGENSLHIHVRNLQDAEAISSARVKVYDFQKQLIIESETNNKGYVSYKIPRKASFIVVENNNQYGYLSIADSYANSVSDFDIGGHTKKEGIDGWVYTERGVWRPGDTIHSNFILEDKLNKIPENHPVTFTVTDARGNKHIEEAVTRSLGGIYTYKIPTEENDPTGIWHLDVTVGNATFHKPLRIETVKPNRLKIDPKIDTRMVLNNSMTLPIEAAWLYGSPASNLNAKVDVSYSSRKTTFEGYRSYTWDDPARTIESNPLNIYDGKLDADGKTNVEIKRGKNFNPPGKLNMKINTRVYEPSGNFSEDFSTTSIDPYSHYVGIKIPESRWGRNYLPRTSVDPIEMIVVNREGNPVRNRNISVGLYEAEWQWWYARSRSNIYRYDQSNHYGSVEKKKFKTDASGKISWRPDNLHNYRYMIRACDDESGHCTGSLFFTSYYDPQSNDGSAKIMQIDSEKTTYSVGEEIKIQVPSNTGSKILVSLENGSEILNQFWVEGQKESTPITIESEEFMAPNIYAHVTLIQSAISQSEDLPLRMYGVLPLTILNTDKILNPEITSKDKVRPEEPFTVTVSEKEGKEMVYTLAVVDEGLLGLTRFNTPNPGGHFHAKQSLGIKTWDLYDLVDISMGKNIEKYISIGGDAGSDIDKSGGKMTRFVPVVKHLGPFLLDKNKKKKHSIEINNYSGAVRVMVVARESDAYGSSEKEIKVVNPLMVLPTVPRVLSPEESFSLPISVFAMEDKIKNVQIEVKTGPGFNGDLSPRNINFNSTGDKLISIPLEATSYRGPTYIEVVASGHGEKSSRRIEMEILHPGPIEKEVTSVALNPGESRTLSFSAIGIQGTNSASIEASSFPAVGLESRIDYLIRYPYGCLEQTTSSVFPQLELASLLSLSSDKVSEINDNVQAGIRRLIKFQLSNGGFSYWTGNPDASDWGTSYAGHFLAKAKESGFYVPNHVLLNWKKFQRDQVRRKQGLEAEGRIGMLQAYRLYTLALIGEPEWGGMNVMRNQKLSTASRFILSAAYALSGNNDIAEDLLTTASLDIKPYRETGLSYGSRLRDEALILDAFLSIENYTGKVDVHAIAKKIATQVSEKRWYSTQTTALSLIALGHYLKNHPQDELDINVTFNNIPVSLNLGNAQISAPLKMIENQDNSVTINNTSEGIAYISLINAGQRPYLTEKKRNAHITSSLKFTDGSDNAVDVSSLSLGTDFTAIIDIANLNTKGSEIDEMALSLMLPSGWEVRRTELIGPSTDSNSSYEYRDIKDDRVHTFFDLKRKKKYKIHLTAAYAGRYYFPGLLCEAMYDNEITARIPGQWIDVK